MSRWLLTLAERAARRMGIDPHQYWHLLRISLVLDFRRQSAVSSGQSTQSALLMTCLVFGFFCSPISRSSPVFGRRPKRWGSPAGA